MDRQLERDWARVQDNIYHDKHGLEFYRLQQRVVDRTLSQSFHSQKHPFPEYTPPCSGFHDESPGYSAVRETGSILEPVRREAAGQHTGNVVNAPVGVVGVNDATNSSRETKRSKAIKKEEVDILSKVDRSRRSTSEDEEPSFVGGSRKYKYPAKSIPLTSNGKDL